MPWDAAKAAPAVVRAHQPGHAWGKSCHCCGSAAHNQRMPASRTFLPQSIQSFGDISRFLREGVADEDSRQLRDSLGNLSGLIEEAVRIRRTSTDAPLIHHAATTLFQGARDHQLLLTGLGSAWHGLYEFGAYQRALWELRLSIAAWKESLEQRQASEASCFDKFELLAWRTLGEALLLIDMYEQGGGVEQGGEPAPSVGRTPWWQRARRWMRR